jgi:hypothetical protein
MWQHEAAGAKIQQGRQKEVDFKEKHTINDRLPTWCNELRPDAQAPVTDS